jgi:hypothetical protein
MTITRRGLLGAGLLLARHNGAMTQPNVVRGLGDRKKTGVQDNAPNTGVNPFLPGTGWDVIFTPSDLAFTEAEAEVYHIYLDGPVGSSVAVLVDGHEWDFVSQGWQNGWDPQQPLLVKYGQSLQFCWSAAFAAGPYDKTGTSNVQPVVRLWLRVPQKGVFW